MDFPQFRKALRAGRGNFHAEEFLLYHKQISIRKQKKVLLTLRLRIACTNPTRCLHQPDALPAPTRRVACTNPTRCLHQPDALPAPTRRVSEGIRPSLTRRVGAVVLLRTFAN